MDAKIVLITGANTGLGYQIVRALCESDKSYSILVGGRSLAKAEQAVQDVMAEFSKTSSNLLPLQIDIEDDQSIEKAFREVQSKYGKLDVLINNAGKSIKQYFHRTQLDQQLTAGTMTMREVWTKTWSVNTVGTQIMTSTFVPLLLKSDDPRLLFMASGTASLTTSTNLALPFNAVPEPGWPKTLPANANIPAYRAAKAGLNMMMREWCRFLQKDVVKVWCLSPGYLATGLGGSVETNKAQGAQDPSVVGGLVIGVLKGERDDDVGKVILREGVQPW